MHQGLVNPLNVAELLAVATILYILNEFGDPKIFSFCAIRIISQNSTLKSFSELSFLKQLTNGLDPYYEQGVGKFHFDNWLQTKWPESVFEVYQKFKQIFIR